MPISRTSRRLEQLVDEARHGRLVQAGRGGDRGPGAGPVGADVPQGPAQVGPAQGELVRRLLDGAGAGALLAHHRSLTHPIDVNRALHRRALHVEHRRSSFVGQSDESTTKHPGNTRPPDNESRTFRNSFQHPCRGAHDPTQELHEMPQNRALPIPVTTVDFSVASLQHLGQRDARFQQADVRLSLLSATRAVTGPPTGHARPRTERHPLCPFAPRHPAPARPHPAPHPDRHPSAKHRHCTRGPTASTVPRGAANSPHRTPRPWNKRIAMSKRHVTRRVLSAFAVAALVAVTAQTLPANAAGGPNLAAGRPATASSANGALRGPATSTTATRARYWESANTPSRSGPRSTSAAPPASTRSC